MMVMRFPSKYIVFAFLITQYVNAIIPMFETKSGLRPYVDVDTEKKYMKKTSSRGDEWELVFSDEFNTPGRSFEAGEDAIWTALDLPDGVNAALEYYSPNMTSTITDEDGNGVFQIAIVEEKNISFSTFNAYAKPPAYEDHNMYYRAGMVQTWNKFCFRGGLMEARLKLPGTVGPNTQNKDVKAGPNERVEDLDYYPTWPGVWLLGNLGRALFTGSTNRVWPWSYNECDPRYEESQRISACDDNPGYGMNPNQGRGAPEIDLLEGGGTDVSTSIQVAPGMPDNFRLVPVNPKKDDNIYCVYGKECDTLGANHPGIPARVYNDRGYKSWYQGLRYAPSSLCKRRGNLVQNPSIVIKNQDNITVNICKVTNPGTDINTCPASGDAYGDNALIDGNPDNGHWNVNENGGCMPVINGYMGSFLCDPDNSDKRCIDPVPRESVDTSKESLLGTFAYQMDAISANTGLPLRAYTGYLKYQVEWVMGEEGYIRWMVEDVPIYEIPAKAVTDPPQDSENSNPKKVMVEEPMYIILNVALSTSWGARPPNPGQPCRGDGSDERVNDICSGFPMYFRVDYIRVWQDLSENSNMTVGCSPPSHPTREWIEGHKEEYEDANNPIIPVVGGGSCNTNDDCTIKGSLNIITGECEKNRCVCRSETSWEGPRCTIPSGGAGAKTFGPSMIVAIGFGVLALIVAIVIIGKMLLADRGPRFRRGGASKLAGGNRSQPINS